MTETDEQIGKEKNENRTNKVKEYLKKRMMNDQDWNFVAKKVVVHSKTMARALKVKTKSTVLYFVIITNSAKNQKKYFRETRKQILITCVQIVGRYCM